MARDDDLARVRRDRIQRLIDTRFEGSKTAFGRAIGRSPSQVGHWTSGIRNPNGDTCREVEIALDLVRGWLDGFDSADTLVAQSVSYTPVSIPSITREELMQELRQGRPLPPKFEVVLWDDAMAPKAPRGTPATFLNVSQRAPQIGDAVLLVLAGEPHVRVLRQAATGGTVAMPTDANYAAFDPEAPGLSVVAVLESLGGGWANLTR